MTDLDLMLPYSMAPTPARQTLDTSLSQALALKQPVLQNSTLWITSQASACRAPQETTALVVLVAPCVLMAITAEKSLTRPSQRTELWETCAQPIITASRVPVFLILASMAQDSPQQVNLLARLVRLAASAPMVE